MNFIYLTESTVIFSKDKKVNLECTIFMWVPVLFLLIQSPQKLNFFEIYSLLNPTTIHTEELIYFSLKVIIIQFA